MYPWLGKWYRLHRNDEGNAAKVRRVYIYSPADALIEHKDKETHNAKAKTKVSSVALENMNVQRTLHKFGKMRASIRKRSGAPHTWKDKEQ